VAPMTLRLAPGFLGIYSIPLSPMFFSRMFCAI
jgi:hypothetical protein